METEKSFTVREVASTLNVSIYTVREMLGDGDLKGYKVRNRWRVKETDLEDFTKTNGAEKEDKKDVGEEIKISK